MTKGSIELVLGGSRSGKSSFAERLAGNHSDSVVYIATCRSAGMDEEMRHRVRRHQEQRPASWTTLEDCFDLELIAATHPGRTVLLDCLTLWLGNEIEVSPNPDQVLATLERGLDALLHSGIHSVIVSNELGMGLVPMSPETRQYRDLVGWANQLVARKAQNVFFLAAGLPMTLKRDGSPSLQ